MPAPKERPCLLWFSHDLRLEDNPALAAALASGAPVVPVAVLDPAGEGEWAPGGASRWWLHHALADLDRQLRDRGLRLILRQGDTLACLRKLCAETGARAVYANRRYEPAARLQQKRIADGLKKDDIEADFSHNAALLFEPDEIKNKSDNPFQVFTPYWRTCRARPWPAPVKADLSRLRGPSQWPEPLALEALGLLPKIGWDAGFYEAWEPTRDGALARFKEFLAESAVDYGDRRDRPDVDGTSRLSPYLHLGQVGPRELVAALVRKGIDRTPGGEKFLAEIGWREFSYHLLYHFSHTPLEPLRLEFADFPWRENEGLLRAWQRGRTGYPLVDAGMRQLWATGWMHNRVRMVAASLLVKHLLQPWQAGARWFWDTLVDADLASNTQGWQWTAGCGADAAPYFRVFNPVTQGERFDPQGEYVRRWVPELAQLPAKHIHRPWEAPEDVLAAAGVRLGEDYPEPVVSHVEGRGRALAAFETFKSAGA